MKHSYKERLISFGRPAVFFFLLLVAWLFLGFFENEANAKELARVTSPVVEMDPLPFYHFRKGETVRIYGTVAGSPDFALRDFHLEWRKESETIWSGLGIEESAGGQSEITDSLIASWNTSTALGTGFYKIQITVRAPGMAITKPFLRVFIDEDFKSGWPKRLDDASFGTPRFPRIADLDGDAKNDLVVQDSNGRIFAWDENGSLLPGWPVNTTQQDIYGGLAIGDLNGDGQNELLVTHPGDVDGVLAEPCKFDVVHVYDSKGQEWPSSPIQADCNFNGTFGYGRRNVSSIPPVLFDLDGDGDLEIITALRQVVTTSEDSFDVIARQLEFYAFHHDGTLVEGWPFTTEFLPGIQFRSQAVGDFDGDSEPEIIMAIQAKTGNSQEGQIYILDKNGNLQFGGPTVLDSDIPSPFALADLGGQGSDLFFQSSQWAWVEPQQAGQIGYWKYDSSRIFGMNETPSALGGWPTDALPIGPGTGETIFADVDGNGIPELLFADYLNPPLQEDEHRIRALARDGRELSSWPKNLMGSVRTPPMAGDIDGDGKQDVLLFTTDPLQQGIDGFGVGQFEVVNHNDKDVPGLPRTVVDQFSGNNIPTYVYGDLGSDGLAELVLVTGTGKVFVWKTSHAYDQSSMDWPMSGHDLHNTSNFDYSPTKIVAASISEVPTVQDNETGFGQEESSNVLVRGSGCSLATSAGSVYFNLLTLFFLAIIVTRYRFMDHKRS